MFVYEKKLQYPVKIANPNPKYANIIISQYGGPDCSNRYTVISLFYFSESDSEKTIRFISSLTASSALRYLRMNSFSSVVKVSTSTTSSIFRPPFVEIIPHSENFVNKKFPHSFRYGLNGGLSIILLLLTPTE